MAHHFLVINVFFSKQILKKKFALAYEICSIFNKRFFLYVSDILRGPKIWFKSCPKGGGVHIRSFILPFFFYLTIFHQHPFKMLPLFVAGNHYWGKMYCSLAKAFQRFPPGLWTLGKVNKLAPLFVAGNYYCWKMDSLIINPIYCGGSRRNCGHCTVNKLAPLFVAGNHYCWKIYSSLAKAFQRVPRGLWTLGKVNKLAPLFVAGNHYCWKMDSSIARVAQSLVDLGAILY